MSGRAKAFEAESMRCIRCSALTRVVETRGQRRRRVCDQGHSMHSIEVWEESHSVREFSMRVALARETLIAKGYLQSDAPTVEPLRAARAVRHVPRQPAQPAAQSRSDGALLQNAWLGGFGS